MVVKTLTHDHGDSDVWNYYDNITGVSVYYDEAIEEVVVSMSSDDYDGSIVLAIPEGAYLLTDRGHIIDWIAPTVKYEDAVDEVPKKLVPSVKPKKD